MENHIHQAEESGYLKSRPDDEECGELYTVPDNFEPEKSRSFFSEKELETIKTVTEKLKDKTATELKELTHLEDAWKNTDHAKLIDYKHAETLKLFLDNNLSLIFYRKPQWLAASGMGYSSTF